MIQRHHSESQTEKSILLENIMWSFNGVIYNSPELFEKSLTDYNLKFDNEFINAQIDIPEILLLLEYIDEHGNDQELTFYLKPDNGKHFTNVELLYKINNEVTQKLTDLDKHYFEGLRLLRKSENGKPAVYALNLGS